MQKVYRSLTGIAATAIFAVVALTATATSAYAQKKVKDQGEYDLYNSILKETDATKKLGLLDQWLQKYPDTDFKEERLQLYNSIKQPAKVVEIGSQMLSKDPKNLTALVLVTANIPLLPEPTPEQAANGMKAAKYILETGDGLKPAAVSDADWKTAKASIEANAHAAITYLVMLPGNTAVRNKDFVAAEKAFSKALDENPDSGQVAYSLGSAIISQKKADRYPEAIYYIARGATLEGPNALPEATRKQVEAYLEKIYKSYHGADPEGLAALKAMAKANPKPPADYKLESEQEIAIRKENEFKTKNPQLALWLGVKKELVGPNGEQYFDTTLKGSAVPKLKGTVISAKPPVRSKELVIGIEKADQPEVTLKFETALSGKPKVGSVVEFEGVPAAFSKDPFNLTFDVEKDKVTGLEMEAAPVVKKAAPRKKK